MLLRGYNDLALRLSHEVPNSPAMDRTAAAEDIVQRRLWALAGQALDAAPIASAPRLYVDALNTMIDQQTGGSRRSTTAYRERFSHSR